MGDGEDYDDYAGHGIDHEESAQDAMGVDLGNGLKSKIRSSEDNPSKPLDKGQASGKEGGVLNAGEKNQQSDKDTNSEEGATWSNRTGERNKMVTAAATGNAAKLAKEVKKNGGIRGTAKVVGPIGTILIIVAMCIGGALGGQSTMLASLVGNLQGNFDPIDVAAAVRSKVLIKSIMSGKNTKGGLWSKFSDHMKSKFAKAGIEVENDGDVENLRYKNSSDEDVKVDADNFDSTLHNETDFHTKYSDGSATYSTSVPEYFDSDSENVMKFLGVSRNTLSDIETSDDYDETKTKFDEDVEAELDEATPRMGADVEGGDKTEEQKTDADGSPYTDEDFEGWRSSTDVDSDADVEAKFKDMVETEVGKGMDFSIVGQAANGVCQLYKVATTINRMIKAYEAAQTVVMAMKILEAVQRMQAGDGGMDTLVDVVGNYLTHEKSTTFDFGNGDTQTVTGSTLSSSPIAAVFGGTKLTGEDPIVKSFVTSQSQFRQIMNVLDNSTGYTSCIGAKIAAGLIDAVGDAFTLGGKKILDFLVGVVLSVSISLIVEAVVSALVPKAVNALKRDFSAFLEGPEASGVLMWGSEQIMGENAKHTAMQPANPQTLTAYVKMKQEVIADRARYDRNNLSPFDTSSEYTFMGSLVRTLGKATLKTSSIVGNIGNITSVVGKSLVSLTPASYAAGTVEEIITEGDCPEINDLNGDKKIASAFCTPHYISDYTTMGEGPEDVMQYWADKGAFDDYDPVDNPNPAIKTDDNELALCVEEYINRGSELGYDDATIEAKYTPAATGSSFWDAVLGAIPIIGGIIDTVNNVDILGHLANILGYKYTEDTKQNHMCERYTLDQRMGESMGIYDKSQTAVFTDNYLKEHPLDNSALGIIARRSGLTKDEAIAHLKMLNALTFIAEYNPEGLGPLFIEEKPTTITIESTENHVYIIGIIQNYAFVEEKRNQNTTA